MWLGGDDRVLLDFPALLFDDEDEEDAAAAAAAKSEAEKPGGGGGANDEEALDMAVPGYPPLTSNGFARTLLFWLGVVALSTLLVVWRRFRAAADAEFPLVRGEDTDEGEEDEETPAAVDVEDRRFRNSASFAARA